MGYNQKNLMEQFFKSLNLENYSFYKDLNGNDRGFVILFKYLVMSRFNFTLN